MGPDLPLRIIKLRVENAEVLGFDTGLGAAAFAQAKLAQLLNHTGAIIIPGDSPRILPWKPRGVIEGGGEPKTMVIWGPLFEGERLDRFLDRCDSSNTGEAQRNQALDALGYWLRARIFLEAQDAPPAPWPAGAILSGGGAYPAGTLFFPPEGLLRRAVEAEGPGAWIRGAGQWVHPDLSGSGASAFTAAALLYRIFCGAVPFPSRDAETLRQDMREGNFLPPGLAAPGLDPRVAGLITRGLSPGRAADGPDTLTELLGPPGSRRVSSFFYPLTEKESASIAVKRERFRKSRGKALRAQRFLRRNRVGIGVAALAALILGLAIGSVISDRGKGPTTRGMAPREVAAAYYRALGELDHPLMEACVIHKAGKDDIALVTNLYVISRVRQAYERNRTLISAQDWIDSGAPQTEDSVFGLSDLLIEAIDGGERDGETQYRASYTLWTPGEGGPLSIPVADELRLMRYRGSWRIAEINRKRG